MYKLELNFPTIQGFYGVNQAWMTKGPYQIKRSCGLSAILNILIYEKILSVHTIKQAAHYLNLMTRPWRPRPWGIPSLSILHGLLNHFSTRPYVLVGFHGSFSLDRVKAFIKKALEAGHPLLLLTFNHKNPHFHNHWVTITGLVEEKEKTYLVASNWGQRQVYSLEQYLASPSIHRSLGYFKKA